MELPEWLTAAANSESRAARAAGEPVDPGRRVILKVRPARFLDKTFQQIVSFIEDTMFNETISGKKGLLQALHPKLKVISLLCFIFVLSLQKSLEGICFFSFLAVLLMFISAIPPGAFVKRLLPAALLTFLISLPVTLNLTVGGDPLFVLLHLGRTVEIGPLVIPDEIAVTRQGMGSALTLLLRVITSVSMVFLLTMTTQPNTFVKTLSSLVPGVLQPLVAISYRYLFFLVRKVEQFIMALRSRQIAPVTSSTGRQWVASRIGLLFSMSMELSNDLSMAMESRGYRGERRMAYEVEAGRLSLLDRFWLLFTILLTGIMAWKSFA